MSESPHRDPQVAAAERLIRLEDELRTLRSTLTSGTSPAAQPARRRWPLLGLLLIPAAAVYVWWSGQPASQTVMRTNAGVSFTVIFRSDVTDVRFETEAGQTVPALYPQWNLPGAGDQPAPSRGASVLLQDSLLSPAGPTRLRVRYRAFWLPRTAILELDAKTDGDRFLRGVLEGLPQWVAFRRFGGNTLVYFTTLLAYKPALREIRYGVGTGPLEHTVHFTRSSELGVAADDETYITVPDATDRMRVQLVYSDGSVSDVRTILRSDSEIH